MKILQVANLYTYKPRISSRYELSKGLLGRGHEVTVYTIDGFKQRLNVERNRPIDVDGIRTYYFRNLSKRLATKIPQFPYYAPVIARKEIMDFDIIHMHELTMLGFIVQHYAKKYNVPYVLQGHGSLFFKMSGRALFSPKGTISIRKKRLIKRARNALFESPTLHNASKVIALTNKEAELCKKIDVDENNIVIIPNGINLSEFENLPERGNFRRKYLIDDDEKIVLYLGRIHQIKGIDLLVRAFSGLLKKMKNVRLVIAGPDDGFLSTLRRLIGYLKTDDKILLTGPLYEKDKLEAYIDADVYILPSIYETFPNTVLEAWACGTPVIVTDRCGVANIMDNAGFVVAYDKDQLKDAIIKALSDKRLRKRFEIEGKKLVREKFSWDNIVGELESLYETVVK
jgi:glycosyltransferase involved in cell wall biosynthesis